MSVFHLPPSVQKQLIISTLRFSLWAWRRSGRETTTSLGRCQMSLSERSATADKTVRGGYAAIYIFMGTCVFRPLPRRLDAKSCRFYSLQWVWQVPLCALVIIRARNCCIIDFERHATRQEAWQRIADLGNAGSTSSKTRRERNHNCKTTPFLPQCGR